MIENELQLRQEITDLKKQIQSLSYIIRMDRISAKDSRNPMVQKKLELEAAMERLLIRVRLEKEMERSMQKNLDKAQPQPFSLD
jgi:hypothetical protein